jgi:hypothetical protein
MKRPSPVQIFFTTILAISLVLLMALTEARYNYYINDINKLKGKVAQKGLKMNIFLPGKVRGYYLIMEGKKQKIFVTPAIWKMTNKGDKF